MLQQIMGWFAGLFDLLRLRGAPGSEDGEFGGYRSGTELDKPWATLLQEFTDEREAWKRNPLARRIIGLTMAYVVGDGFQVEKDIGPAESKAWDNAKKTR